MRRSLGVVLVLLPGACSPAAADEPIPPSLQAARLLKTARVTQAEDIAAWRRFRFHRRAERSRLDEQGRSLRSDVLESVVTPNGEGFDETLVRVDGRPPSPDEVAQHRRAATFSRHFRTLISGQGEEGGEGGYSFGHLLRLSSLRYAGEESVSGVPAYRLDFRPDETVRREGIAGRLAGAMAGSLWLTRDGLHLLRARARTIRPVSIAFLLSKVTEMDVELDSQPVGAGIWLPQRIEVRTIARVLAWSVRRGNRFVYSDFEPVSPPKAESSEAP